MQDRTLLSVSGLCKSFERKGVKITAVDDVSFEVSRGEILVIAGESGSGKSTIVRLLLGMIRRDSGDVIFEGRRIDESEAHDMQYMRKHCSVVQQDPYDSLNPQMRILDIVAEPLMVEGSNDASERHKRALAALADVGLDSEVSSRYPHELSGGQRQRVAIARALSTRPALIIADEPVSMLDVSVRAEVLEIMAQLRQTRGISYIYITHDLATARHFGDTLAIMHRGRIVESGAIARVLDSPRHEYTRALLDAIPRLGAKRDVSSEQCAP